MNINELTEARTRLINEKSGIVAQLAEVNSTLKATLPIKQYQAATQARVNLVSRLSKIEIEIGELNISIRNLHSAQDDTREFGKWRVRQLVAIRDQWHGYSMSSTNPKPARAVAWKFSQELNEVLKSYFNPGEI